MKINYSNFKKQCLINKDVIIDMFNECEERRSKVEVINSHLNAIKTSILYENDYHTAPEYKDVVGFDLIKDADYDYFITNENNEGLSYRQNLFEKIISDEILNEYFDLSEMTPSIICGLKAHIDYKKDFPLMNMLRKFKGDKEKSINFNHDLHIKEYEIIKNMIDVIKYL